MMSFAIRHSFAILVIFSILPTSTAICSIDADDSPIDCMYGLWNENKCECECIPPYCPDTYGQCAATWVCNPTNPWFNCIRGIDCPWWRNPLKANSCATGPEVPPGIWEVWGSQGECCALYPQSDACRDFKEVSKRPTPFPTIGFASLPDTEIISVRFSGLTIPNGVGIIDFQNRLREVVKIVILDLAEQYSSLKILDLEYRRADSRNEDIIFDITVPRESGVSYASIINNSIKDRITFIYNDITEWLRRQNVDVNEFINRDFCFDWEGQSYCSTRAPTRRPTPEPTQQPKQIIPVQFLDIKLPIDVSVEAFKEEMRNVAKRIVLGLAERYGSLKVLDLQLRDRRRRKTSLVGAQLEPSGVHATHTGEDTNAKLRVLQRLPFDLTYEVIILPEPGVDFGKVIQNAFYDSRDEILSSITYWIRNDQGVTNDSRFEFCLDSGDSLECSTAETRRPTRRPTSRPTNTATETFAIEFTDVTLPVSIEFSQFQKEMRILLINILGELSDRYSSLNVLDVTYRVGRKMFVDGGYRKLQRVVDLAYDVTIIRQDGIDFQNIIIDAIRSNDETILQGIVEWMNDQDIQGEEDAIFQFCLGSDCFSQLAPPSQNGSRETISIEFTDVNLPRSVRIVAFRERLRILLTNILDDLAAQYMSLEIISVKYRDRDNRRGNEINNNDRNRNLQRIVDLTYDVTVQSQGDIGIKSIISDAIRTNDKYILQNIIEWMKQNIDDEEDLTFEFCLDSDCFSQEASSSPNGIRETFRIHFTDVRLPRSINVANFREQLRAILENILINLADQYETLTILSVKYSDDRRATEAKGEYPARNLQRVTDLTYHVTVRHEGNFDFKNIILDAVSTNNEFILQRVIEWMTDQGIDEDGDEGANFEYCLGSDCFTQVIPSSPIVVTETISIEFSDISLPKSVNIIQFREELRKLLKNLLDNLAGRYETLEILEVQHRQNRRSAEVYGESNNRKLQQTVNLSYDVTIRYQGDIDFSNIILNAARTSGEAILEGMIKWINDQGVGDDDDTIIEFCLGPDCFSHEGPSSPNSSPDIYFEEVIPIRFSVRGLPNNIKDQKKMRRELKDVLTRIVFFLSGRYDFSLLKVEYRDVIRVETREVYAEIEGDHSRALQLQFDERLHHMMFDVTIAHKGDIDLEELIRSNYDDIIEDVLQDSLEFESVTDAFEFEVCVESDTCATNGGNEITYTYNDSASIKSVENDNSEGVPFWVIILIVILVMLLCCLCCICIACCIRSRQQSKLKEEVTKNKIEVKNHRSKSKKLKSCDDSNSDDTSDDDEDDQRMTPQSTMAIRPYVPQQHAPNQLRLMQTPMPPQQQYSQLPPPSQPHPYCHPFQSVIHNNIPKQSYPILALRNEPHEQSSDSTAYYSMASNIHDGDYSSAQCDESVADLSHVQIDPSVGGIGNQSYADFDSIVRPDPSMYSLFTTRSTKTKKSRKSNKRVPLEPSVYTQASSKSKKNDPTIYLEYGGDEAPGFKSSESVYFRDNQSVQNNTRPLMLTTGMEEEMSAVYSFYSQQDPSVRYELSETHSQQSQQHFAFSDSSEVMSMMSGFSNVMDHGKTISSHMIHLAEKTKSKHSGTEKKKNKANKSKKSKRKASEKTNIQHSRSYHEGASSSSPDRSRSLPIELV